MAIFWDYSSNAIQTNKNIYWKEDYECYEIEIISLKAKIYGAFFIIFLNKTIFAYEIEDNFSPCEVIKPSTFTYTLEDNVTKTGYMSNFNYSNPNITISWGKNNIFLRCNELSIPIGYFKIFVYLSKEAEHFQHINETIASGYYDGIRKNPTEINPKINFID